MGLATSGLGGERRQEHRASILASIRASRRRAIMPRVNWCNQKDDF